MQKTASKNFFFTVFSSKEPYSDFQSKITSGGFYQYLSSELIRESALRDFANNLLILADRSDSFHFNAALDSISQMLLDLPLPDIYKSAGRYYQAVSSKRKGNIEEAWSLFDQVCRDAPLFYVAGAMQALGAICFIKGQFSSAMPFYLEAGRIASHKKCSNPTVFLQSQCMIAALNGVDGNHQGAATALRGLLPMIRFVAQEHPVLWFDYHNSLAVELMEAGEFEEARYACDVALRSPFAPLYPEWSETARDLEIKTRRRSRSVVSFSDVKSLPERTKTHTAKPEAHNVIAIEKIRSVAGAELCQEPERSATARIIDFPLRSQMADGEDIFDDPVYLDKRYHIMVTAAETTDLKLLDELYGALIRRRRPQGPPSKQ
jgi:tetratricopeptide (TPR) repeat protein